MKPITPTDEKALLLRLQDGDEQAYTFLYQQYHPALYLYAFRLSNDEDDAADLVQELFIYIWDKRRQLTFTTSFRAYLYRSIRHRFLNLEEHRKVRSTFKTNFQDYLNRGENNTETYIAESELFQRIDALVAKLPVNMGKVFQMRNENHTDKEIATRLDISEKTVRNLMSEAVKSFRAKLKYFIVLLLIWL